MTGPPAKAAPDSDDDSPAKPSGGLFAGLDSSKPSITQPTTTSAFGFMAGAPDEQKKTAPESIPEPAPRKASGLSGLGLFAGMDTTPKPLDQSSPDKDV